MNLFITIGVIVGVLIICISFWLLNRGSKRKQPKCKKFFSRHRENRSDNVSQVTQTREIETENTELVTGDNDEDDRNFNSVSKGTNVVPVVVNHYVDRTEDCRVVLNNGNHQDAEALSLVLNTDGNKETETSLVGKSGFEGTDTLRGVLDNGDKDTEALMDFGENGEDTEATVDLGENSEDTEAPVDLGKNVEDTEAPVVLDKNINDTETSNEDGSAGVVSEKTIVENSAIGNGSLHEDDVEADISENDIPVSNVYPTGRGAMMSTFTNSLKMVKNSVASNARCMVLGSRDTARNQEATEFMRILISPNEKVLVLVNGSPNN